MDIYYAPQATPLKTFKSPSVFLAGSIEMNTAEKWQDKAMDELRGLECTIYNPRRQAWDNSWQQDIKDPNFYEQVHREMDHLDKADVIFMYFDPNTKSPITLLELGLMAGKKKIIIYCPAGFWRKGNIDIICEKYGIHEHKERDTAINELKKYLSS